MITNSNLHRKRILIGITICSALLLITFLTGLLSSSIYAAPDPTVTPSIVATEVIETPGILPPDPTTTVTPEIPPPPTVVTPPPPGPIQLQLVNGVICDNAEEPENTFTLLPDTPSYFTVWGKAGSWYEIETQTDVFSDSLAVDTLLRIYLTDPRQGNAAQLLAENDDFGDSDNNATGHDSKIQLLAQHDALYWIEVTNRIPNSGGRFCVSAKQLLSSTPVPPYPGDLPPWLSDPCETPPGNGTFETACLLLLEESHATEAVESSQSQDQGTDMPTSSPTPNPQSSTTERSFLPPTGSGTDNDFYKVWAKAGQSYTCETYALSNNNDTNMIIYNANQVGLGGNDDIAPGNLASRVTVTADVTGWLYVLVGPYVEVDYEIAHTYTYKIRCYNQVLDVKVPTTTTTETGEKLTGPDGCEQNDTFNVDTACTIPYSPHLVISPTQQIDPTATKTEHKYAITNLNFAPWSGATENHQGVDRDYFKLWVKENTSVRCQTYGLADGNDTVMTIFHEGDATSPLVPANDDIRTGNLSSQVEVSREIIPTTGWLLILIEPAMPGPLLEPEKLTYNISCDLFPGASLGNQTTSLTTSAAANPAPTANNISVVPKPNDPANKSFTVAVYYDSNSNGRHDSEIIEGTPNVENVEGMPIFIVVDGAFNPAGGYLTGKNGMATVTVNSTANTIQLIIPYLGINMNVDLLGLQQIEIRIKSNCICN